jgi:hypothetical protein
VLVAVRAWARRHAGLLLVLAAIVAVGIFYRFHQLDAVPSDPTSDHAEKLLDVHDLEQGARPVFFPRNTGREPAQFYFSYLLIAIGFKSLSFGMLKWGTALVGTLAIPAVFLFADEVAGRVAGLAAAALYAVSAWPVETARAGLRFPYAQLATALALWLLFRYLRTRDRRDALACGIAVAFGLHGYTAFRIVPLVIGGLLVLAWLMGRRAGETWRLPAGGGGLIAGTALIACIPLGRYALEHPDLVSYRASSRLDGGRGLAGSAEQLGENVWNALLAFNWRGDSGWVNAVHYAPLLDTVTAAALLAGVVLLVHELLTRRSFRAAALLLAAPALMLSSALSIAFPIENPAVNRIGPAAPVIFLTAALPVAYLWQALVGESSPSALAAVRARPATAAALVAAGALAFAAAARENYTTYFHTFAVQYTAGVPNSREIASTLRGEGSVDIDHMYVLGWPGWVDGRNVGFALGAPDWYLDHNRIPGAAIPRIHDGRPLRIALNTLDVARRRALEREYPGGRYEVVVNAVAAHSIGVYSVPAR